MKALNYLMLQTDSRPQRVSSVVIVNKLLKQAAIYDYQSMACLVLNERKLLSYTRPVSGRPKQLGTKINLADACLFEMSLNYQ